MANATVHIIHAIIQLNRFIPIVLARVRIEMIVACHLRWELAIGIILLSLRVKTERQGLPGQIIKVVIHIEGFRHIVALPQILNIGLACVGEILASYVVGHKVDDHLQTGLMRSRHQSFELLHSIGHLVGQIRINIIVVLYGIRRSSLSLHDRRMVFTNAILGVICFCRMLNHACVPNVCNA